MKDPEDVVRTTPDYDGQWEMPFYYHPKPAKWRYIPALVVLIVGLILMASSAFARTPLEDKLLAFIERETGYDTSRIVPRYEYWPVAKLNQVYYQANYSGQENVLALAIEGTIMLPIGFEVELQPEVLLHELFHLVVWENGIEFPCIGAEEQAAYRLQDKFVEETGQGMKSDPFFVLLMGCDMRIPR